MTVSDLTWSQRLIWTGQQLHPNVPLYNMALAFDLVGPLSAKHFRAAFRSVVDRSEALRTVVVSTPDGPAARVVDRRAAPVNEISFEGSEDPEIDAAVWARARSQRPFEPGELLFDCALLRLGPAHHVWYFNQHHLTTDAWSAGLVFRYVEDSYLLSLDGLLDQAPALRPYSEYVEFLEQFAGSRAQERAREHWRAFKDAPPRRASLYGKGVEPHSTLTRRRTARLDADVSAQIRALSQHEAARGLSEHASRFNVFAALLLGFISRISGQERVAIGAPAHNRPTAAFKDTLGLFIEVFPLTTEVDPDGSFTELVRAVRKEAGAFLRYAQPGTSDAQMNRSVNVVLNYINANFPSFAGLETRSRWIHPGHGDAAHDVRVQVHDFDAAGEFVLHLDLAADRFDPSEQDQLVSHFLHFVASATASPDTPLRSLALMGPEEAERQATMLASETDSGFRATAPTVVHAFREAVHSDPGGTALREDDVEVTYEELQRRVVGVARALEPLGVRGRTVVLNQRRSSAAVVAILGILEAGGSYVPLEPDAPPERTQYILDVLKPAAAVAPAGSLPASLPTVDVSAVGSDPTDAEVDEWLKHHPGPAPGDLAYVLFTSGSTGRPKGVGIEHSSLIHYAEWAAGEYLGTGASTFALFTPLTFDLTVSSIFAPLVSGNSVVVYEDRGEAVDDAVGRVFADDAVDVVKLTPSHLALVASRPDRTQRIKTLVVGGEELTTDLAHAAAGLLPDGGRVVNEYGPTESTVACTVHTFDPTEDTERSVPIGRPIPGASIALVDEDNSLVPTGCAGEILVGGTGVARGYVADEALTAERFQSPADPWVFAAVGPRAYRTGDLGRWRSDGTLEYLGRIDRQVKIHGVRVEPGEIEAVLERHAGVTRVAVVAAAAAPSEYAKQTHTDVIACVRCGIPSNHPDVTMTPDNVCSLCVTFEGYDERANRYFGSMAELEDILRSRGEDADEFDCMMLLSGGKDSSYALYRLVGMGLRVCAATLDNGYISDGAKANIRRVTEDLGVPHEFLTAEAMNEIFVESLERFSNVCQGCFKTMYTLAFNVATQRGIPSIVTGLSRGQFFETRLTEELFVGPPADRDSLDLMVLDARKAYHRADGPVNRLLDTSVFADDEAFDRVQFVDFYRYCDVELSEMLDFLDQRAPWIRPADTGRSTNCLINDVGIHVHRQERGYHNYALPYSWDVRLGHKQRDAALAELDDDIDAERVKRILDEIGYTPKTPTAGDGRRLVAFVVGDAGERPQELRGFLKTQLPSFMIPSQVIPIAEIPLTPRGKVDTSALVGLATGSRTARRGARDSTPPATPTEAALIRIWSDALGGTVLGTGENFFDLGGDSITAIRIAARASREGLAVTANDMFRLQTVRELAAAADEAVAATATKDPPAPAAEAKPAIARQELDQVAELLRRADRRDDS